MNAIPPFDAELLRRYDKPGPRYTSYPTAPQFSPAFGEAAFREAARDRIAVAGFRGRAQFAFAEARVEMRRGRIGGVARTGPVVAAEQVGVEHRDRIHAPHPGAGLRGRH